MIQISSAHMEGVWFTAAVNGEGRLVACAFSDRKRKESERVVKETVPVDFSTENDSSINRWLQQLYALFSGRGETDLRKVDLSRVTDFRKRVYLQLIRIPKGKVTTYGAIAEKLGSKGYSRAVGTAAATNPMPLAIPCHRLVPVSLHVGNYGTPGRRPSEGAYVKRALLSREGVKFQKGRIMNECVWSPN